MNTHQTRVLLYFLSPQYLHRESLWLVVLTTQSHFAPVFLVCVIYFLSYAGSLRL
jgi:hypothetical protein